MVAALVRVWLFKLSGEVLLDTEAAGGSRCKSVWTCRAAGRWMKGLQEATGNTTVNSNKWAVRPTAGPFGPPALIKGTVVVACQHGLQDGWCRQWGRWRDRRSSRSSLLHFTIKREGELWGRATGDDGRLPWGQQGFTYWTRPHARS